MRLTWDDVRLDDQDPIIRVGRGKLRGRRAVRVVPILPVLLPWLKWAREKNLPLVDLGDSRVIREVVDWQPDICRHSWIIPAKSYGPSSTRIDRDTLIKLKAHGINGTPARRPPRLRPPRGAAVFHGDARTSSPRCGRRGGRLGVCGGA